MSLRRYRQDYYRSLVIRKLRYYSLPPFLSASSPSLFLIPSLFLSPLFQYVAFSLARTPCISAENGRDVTGDLEPRKESAISEREKNA